MCIRDSPDRLRGLGHLGAWLVSVAIRLADYSGQVDRRNRPLFHTAGLHSLGYRLFCRLLEADRPRQQGSPQVFRAHARQEGKQSLTSCESVGFRNGFELLRCV